MLSPPVYIFNRWELLHLFTVFGPPFSFLFNSFSLFLDSYINFVRVSLAFAIIKNRPKHLKDGKAYAIRLCQQVKEQQNDWKLEYNRVRHELLSMKQTRILNNLNNGQYSSYISNVLFYWSESLSYWLPASHAYCWFYLLTTSVPCLSGLVINWYELCQLLVGLEDKLRYSETFFPCWWILYWWAII